MGSEQRTVLATRRMSKFTIRNVYLAISLLVLQFNDCESAAFPNDGNCKQLLVTGDTYGACTGIYSLTDEKTRAAPNYSVYQKVNATSVYCGRDKKSYYADSCEKCPQEESKCGRAGRVSPCQWTNQKCIIDERKEEDLLSSCGYIFFFPDSVYGAKGWRISLGEKLYTCENGSPDCGDYFYRSSIEKQKFWLDKDAAWTINPVFWKERNGEITNPQLQDARLKVECLET